MRTGNWGYSGGHDMLLCVVVNGRYPRLNGEPHIVQPTANVQPADNNVNFEHFGQTFQQLLINSLWVVLLAIGNQHKDFLEVRFVFPSLFFPLSHVIFL